VEIRDLKARLKTAIDELEQHREIIAQALAAGYVLELKGTFE
jgi:hypothetical protein